MNDGHSDGNAAQGGQGGRLARAMRELGIPMKEARHADAILKILVDQRRAARARDFSPSAPTLNNFLSFALPRAHLAQGQIFQDLWVLFELGAPEGGYFVEFGATNGRTMSNTYLLETGHGWNGIVAEPNPDYHEALAANRGCAISHDCVWSETGARLPFLCTAQGMFSRLADVNPQDHNEAAKRADPREIMVETITLDDLLDAHGAPDVIDYLSVDTEGSELDILRAFDFSRRFVRCLSVEHNFTPMRHELHALLTAQGYLRRFPEFTRFDDWYVHRDVARPEDGA